MKVLFVCHGNINRSAAGEIILRKMMPDWSVKSAGVKTSNGKITAKKMRNALRLKGYDEIIRSTAINKVLVDWADIIFYMDESNKKRLIQQFGKEIIHKSEKISKYLGLDKIPDPHFAKDDALHFEVINMLETALSLYAKKH